MIISNIEYSSFKVYRLRIVVEHKDKIKIRLNKTPILVRGTELFHVNGEDYNIKDLVKYFKKNKDNIDNLLCYRFSNWWYYDVFIPRTIDTEFIKLFSIKPYKFKCRISSSYPSIAFCNYFIVNSYGVSYYWIDYLRMYYPELGYKDTEIILKLRNGDKFILKLLDKDKYKILLAKAALICG